MTHRIFLAWILVLGLALPGSLLAAEKAKPPVKAHEKSETQRPPAEKLVRINCDKVVRLDANGDLRPTKTPISELKTGDMFVMEDPVTGFEVWNWFRKKKPPLRVMPGTVAKESRVKEGGGDKLVEYKVVDGEGKWSDTTKEEEAIVGSYYHEDRNGWEESEIFYPGRKKGQEMIASASSPSTVACKT